RKRNWLYALLGFFQRIQTECYTQDLEDAIRIHILRTTQSNCGMTCEEARMVADVVLMSSSSSTSSCFLSMNSIPSAFDTPSVEPSSLLAAEDLGPSCNSSSSKQQRLSPGTGTTTADEEDSRPHQSTRNNKHDSRTILKG
ncbi:unnamed protein product, partial [Amoebophrya sp. A25]